MLKCLPDQKGILCPECKKKILVLPDIAVMAKAIEHHALAHRKKVLQIQVINNLTQQLLLVLTAKNQPKKVYLLIESYFGVRRVLGVALTESLASDWVDIKRRIDPSGSYFYDKSSVVMEA